MLRLSIKSALISVFVLIAVSMGAMQWASWEGLVTLKKGVTETTAERLPAVELARSLEATFLREDFAYAKHLLAVNKETMGIAEQEISAAAASADAVLSAYANHQMTDEEATTFEQLKREYAQYRESGVKLVKLSASVKAMARTVFDQSMREIAGDISAASDKLVDINSQRAAASAEASEQAYGVATQWMLGLMAVSAVICGLAVAYALLGIALPIQKVTAYMSRLAKGETTEIVPGQGRKDEIGAMSAAVEVFRQGAIANARLEADAHEQRVRAEAERKAVQEQAEAEAAERLQNATSGLAEGLRRLAKGDLAIRLETAFSSEFEPLRQDFNASAEQLCAAFVAIESSVTGMEVGIREGASSSENLAKRTEQQAAALEETAAALDEITVNVNNTTQRTADAREVAGAANRSAEHSASVVSQAEDAMRRIEGRSQEIANIIGVIDEIAFQTNLLALNAGVEAARAGEAGKGFAVVAQEVRELAQRSAKAAREIKDLITSSTNEVESGVSLVHETGESLSAIGKLIAQMNEHMDQIANASREQSMGLAEINSAINAMDQTTQQNAAMVEEANAGTAALRDEVIKLHGLVSEFQLGDMRSGGGPAAARAVARRQQHVAPRVQGNLALKNDDWQQF